MAVTVAATQKEDSMDKFEDYLPVVVFALLGIAMLVAVSRIFT